MGLYVIVLDSDCNAPGLQLGDAGFVVDITDADACLAIARRERIDGVVHVCSEVSMAVMGRINEELGLYGIDAATAFRATNKVEMRRAFGVGGAPSPKSVGAATEAEALVAAATVGLPLIVKPSRSSGSRGVSRVENLDEPAVFLRAFHRAVEQSRDPSAVIEAFIEGPEFSVEILVWEGSPRVLAVTDKITTGAPYFVEIGHSQPTQVNTVQRRLIEEAAVKGVLALGIDWAAAHAEVRLSPEGPYIIEIGARLGGDYITTELVPRSTGINMVEGAIRLALGEVPDLMPRSAPKGAAIRYIIPPPGRVVRIENMDAGRLTKGVVVFELGSRLGDNVPECTSSLSRVGHVIAEGSTACVAIAAAEAARDVIRVVTA